jgi:hypothetical protein
MPRLRIVEQAAHEVAPPDLQRTRARRWHALGPAALIWRPQVERSVWTLLVEVADVDAEDALELAATEDQKTVEALSAHAANPAFGVGARARRLDGRSNDLDASAAEDRVEGAAEFRVSVVDQEVRARGGAVIEIHQQVTRLLNHPQRVGCLCDR